MMTRVPGAVRLAAAAWGLALALAGSAGAADVDIALVRMGVGNHVRPGDMTALLVRVTSGLQAPVQARIEWSVRNADGDVARYARDAALAPGAPTESARFSLAGARTMVWRGSVTWRRIGNWSRCACANSTNWYMRTGTDFLSFAT